MTKTTKIGTGVGFIRYNRITGYISQYTRINDAKQAEIHDRTINRSQCEECNLVKHSAA